MNLLRNPEFVRNCWLELTPQRLLAAPAILGLIFLLSYFADKHSFGVHDVAMTLFVLMTVMWGAKLAGDSLTEELIQGTWDTQRLSGLSAGQMTLGKLFGGPVFGWYGGVICALAYLVFAPADSGWPTLRSLLVAMGTAVSFHAATLLSGLTLWRKFPQQLAQRARSRGVGLVLILFVAPQLLVWLVSSKRVQGSVTWYGMGFDSADFTLLCVILAVFWSTYGLYRAMREELAFRDAPLAWLAFLLFIFAFSGGWFYGEGHDASGFMSAAPPVLRHLAFCASLSWAATYVLLFSER